MNEKYVYAFRGWIAFVAFIDLGAAIRLYIERKCFVGEFSNPGSINSVLPQNDATLPRILGAFCILKTIILIHCTLFIHQKPVVSLGIVSLLLSILVYLSEALVYQSSSMNFYIIFPCILYGLTIAGFILIPGKESLAVYDVDENVELVRKATFLRRRKLTEFNY